MNTTCEPNVVNAQKHAAGLFLRFANKISAAERNDFFDPRNRDTWTSAFARFLEGQIDPDFPSND